MYKTLRTKLTLTLFILCTSQIAMTETVPELINYQGKLTDATGEPLATGEYKLTFKLWDHATAAEASNLVWTEVHDAVPVVRGQFNVVLGGITSLSEKFGAPARFLSIAIADGVDIAPRQQLLSAPFALNAESAKHASEADSLSTSVNIGLSDAVSEEHATDSSSWNGPDISSTLTTSGGPVMVQLQSKVDPLPTESWDGCISVESSAIGQFRIIATNTQTNEVSVIAFASLYGSGNNDVPSSSISGIQPLTAGTYTFKVQCRRLQGSSNLVKIRKASQIVAVELR